MSVPTCSEGRFPLGVDLLIWTWIRNGFSLVQRSLGDPNIEFGVIDVDFGNKRICCLFWRCEEQVSSEEKGRAPDLFL